MMCSGKFCLRWVDPKEDSLVIAGSIFLGNIQVGDLSYNILKIVIYVPDTFSVSGVTEGGDVAHVDDIEGFCSFYITFCPPPPQLAS